MAATLQEYLISLGFRVDDKTYKKFQASVANGAKEAAGLGAVVVGTATAIAVAVAKVAEEYRSLGFAAERTGSTISGLKAYSYAARQIGIDAGASAAALESFSAAQRTNPGIKAFVGIEGGTGKDSIEQMENFVEQQKKLYGETGYFVAAMKAELAGIPESTFFQMWHHLPEMRAANAEIIRMRTEAGLTGKEVDDQTKHFAGAWDHLLDALSIGKDRIGLDLMGPTEKAIVALDGLIQAFNKADVASGGWLGTIVGINSALGGTAAALALVLRFVGLGGVAGAALRGVLGLAGGALSIAASPVVAGAAAVYYGGGFNGATAGKDEDEPLSKEYRAKHGGNGGGAGGNAGRDATIDYFVKQGWSRAAATGIAANLSAESKFNPADVGDGGSAYGIAQWHPDRQAAFKAWSGKDIHGSSLEDQLAFIQHELTQGSDQQARRAGEKLRGTNDPYDAGAIFSGLYERPGDAYGQAHARGKQAANWYDTPLTSAPGGGGPVTVTQTNHNHIIANNAREAGDALERANDRAAGDLVRNTQGLTR
jgi:hypothetical protein